MERERAWRMRDAVATLLPLAPEQFPALPAGYDQPPPARGESYKRAKDVPPMLQTKSDWRRYGRTIRPKEQPWGHVYSNAAQMAAYVRLYAYEQTRPIQETPSRIKAILAPLDVQIGHHAFRAGHGDDPY